MSALVHAEVDGERLTTPEIAAFFNLLAVAGNDTTRHSTSHAAKALDDNPDQRAWLLEDLDGRLPGAVEEFVRWASPVSTFRRTATRDTEVGGQPIAAGERVVMFYGSGNRDETAFDDPVPLRRGPLAQPPPRVRRRRGALLPGRVARAHAAALRLPRAPDPRARPVAGRAGADGLQRHQRREAHALQPAVISQRCRHVVESSWFDPLMLGIIFVNAVTLGARPTTRSTTRSATSSPSPTPSSSASSSSSC